MKSRFGKAKDVVVHYVKAKKKKTTHVSNFLFPQMPRASCISFSVTTVNLKKKGTQTYTHAHGYDPPFSGK